MAVKALPRDSIAGGVSDRTIDLHRGGKIKITEQTAPSTVKMYLAMAYTPGVGRICTAPLTEQPDQVYDPDH